MSVARTLAILKPDVVAHPVILEMVGREILTTGFRVRRACRIHLSHDDAARLYSVHFGKFFYARLIRHMTSGPVVAMELESTNGEEPIAAWRRILGPSKLFANLRSFATTTVDARPLRLRFAVSDTRNLAHGSDSPGEVDREMAVFDKFMQPIEDPMALFQLPLDLRPVEGDHE